LQEMAGLKGNIRRALVEDLATINTVVAGAVMAWPMAERAKRLALTTLLYDNIDMANYELLVFEEAGNVMGVAAWDPAGFTLAGDEAAPGCFIPRTLCQA
jgi:hypothetical protein